MNKEKQLKIVDEFITQITAKILDTEITIRFLNSRIFSQKDDKLRGQMAAAGGEGQVNFELLKLKLRHFYELRKEIEEDKYTVQ